MIDGIDIKRTNKKIEDDSTSCTSTSFTYDSYTDDYDGGPIMNMVRENSKVLPKYLITYE